MVAVGWGALAIGGAYPWAYWPLAMICAVTGIVGLRADRTAGAMRDGAGVSRRLSIVLGAVGAAMLLQIVPLPLAWLRTISPQTIGVLADTDFNYGAGLVRFHALSLDPASTGAALALYGSFAMMLVGMARVFGIDREASRRFIEVLTVFGVVLALVGIVQKPLYTGKVLGIWEPEAVGIPFGPFVNRNHFAGWMLMALPLALGLLCAGLEQGMRGLRPGLRYRILWLSSPEASRLILLGAAALVMAMSLVLTMSRSGISALMVSLMLMGWIIARGVKGRSRRTAAGVFLVVLFVTAIGWVGADSSSPASPTPTGPVSTTGPAPGPMPCTSRRCSRPPAPASTRMRLRRGSISATIWASSTASRTTITSSCWPRGAPWWGCRSCWRWCCSLARFARA